MIGFDSAVTIFCRFIREETQHGCQQREVDDGDHKESLINRADVSYHQLNRIEMTEATCPHLLLYEHLACNGKDRQIR